jgi:uronate dehydrogenase
LPGNHIRADLSDTAALCDAARGVHSIIHVAGVPERERFAEALVPGNIIGTHNVLEAARLAGVHRVVYASSVRVVGGLNWESGTIGLEAGYAPADHYGVSKATCELLGEMYARRFGMSVIAARLGWFVRNREEAEKLTTLELGPRIYLSQRDAVAFFECALECSLEGFAAVFVTSRNAGDSAFDLAPARKVCGYDPTDTFPEGSSWNDDVTFPSPLQVPSLLPARGKS